MDSGCPHAEPPPAYMDLPPNPPPVSVKPVFTVQASTKLQGPTSTRPTCLLAMRAEVAVGQDQRLVRSSPFVILEADAGSDPDTPSEDLKEAFEAMAREMTWVFVSAWRGVNEPMKVLN